MEDARAPSRRLLTWLWVPLLLCSWPGIKGQEQEKDKDKLKIWQSPGPLSVSAGETLTLNCTLTGSAPPGGVKWHKGSDRSQMPIYGEKGQFATRTTRVVSESLTDFTIQISQIRPEDAGTYYCVKYRAGSPEREFKSGPGTEVSVIATPSQPLVSGPPDRVTAGSTATFNCSSEGFSPRYIELSWLKDGSRINAPPPTVLPEGESISYRVSSTVEVPLTKEDAKSELVCQISHSTLRTPLMQAFRLGSILRVPPRVQVEVKPSPPVQLNASVTVTCNVEGFFPQDTKLSLFSTNKTETGKAEPATENRDGTFSLKSSLQMQASEEKNMSAFMCLVEHDSQPPINETAVLLIKAETEVNKPSSPPGTDTKIAISVAVVCALLVLLVIAVLYLIHARHNKGKDPTSVRLHESEKPSGGPNQDPDPDVTYADLNFDKAPKTSPPQAVEVSQQSEYASVQTGQPAASDENVTYADLDMVHLSKAPKRPAPKPEEASSEYASVQVQSK